MRKTISLSIFTLLVAAAGFAMTARAQEDETSSNETATVVPGILPAFITAGDPDPAGKVPGLDAVPGSDVGNFDIAQPTTVLLHGHRYVYSVALQAANYTGSYTVAYRLTHVVAGKVEVLQSGTIIANTKTKPENYWVWVILAGAIPDSPGMATLEGVITYGKNTATTSVPVLIK